VEIGARIQFDAHSFFAGRIGDLYRANKQAIHGKKMGISERLRDILRINLKEGFADMGKLSARTACIRMAIILLSVCAIDAAVALFVANPAHLCAVIPALIPLLTPLVLLPPRGKRKA